jgi:hypothetical protein
MIGRTILIVAMIALAGLGLVYKLAGGLGSPQSGGAKVYDLTDGKFDKITVPPGIAFDSWDVYNPGPVRINMPYDYSFAGVPASITFGETPFGRGMIFHCAGQRFEDAYQLALTYCERYSLDPRRIIAWHDVGKGRDIFPAADAANKNDPGMEIAIDVRNNLPSPYAYSVNFCFGWPKTYNQKDARDLPKSPGPVNIGEQKTGQAGQP